jgi:hypothetical protein
MLAEDRLHGGREPRDPRDRLLEKTALLLLGKVIAEMIPQFVHG